MIAQQLRLPHPIKQDWGGAPVTQLCFAGMRKTIDQVIGSLAAAYVPITNYQGEVYTDPFGVSWNLANGTLAMERVGNYTLSIGLDCTFTADNNSSRSTKLRLFNVTTNQAVPDASSNVYAGAYVAGLVLNGPIPVTISVPNQVLRLELGGGSTFAAFTVLQANFATQSLGPI